MVQPKNKPDPRMATRKMLADNKKKLDENTIRFEWYVIEHTPGYNTGGYYDQDIPEKNVIVSPYYNSKEEAEEWMDKHVADKGNTLKVKRRRLLRKTWTEWVYY